MIRSSIKTSSQKDFVRLKKNREPLKAGFLIIVSVFIGSQLVTAFLFNTAVINRAESGMDQASRIHVVVLKLFSPARGETVLVDYSKENPSFFIKAIDMFVSFFTLRRVSVMKSGPFLGSGLVPGVIAGLPGERVMIDHNQLYIKPMGSDKFVSVQDYEGLAHLGIKVKASIADKHDDIIELGKNEYYIVSPAGRLCLDSRQLGPVRKDSIHGVVRFRYWPLSEFGPE